MLNAIIPPRAIPPITAPTITLVLLVDFVPEVDEELAPEDMAVAADETLEEGSVVLEVPKLKVSENSRIGILYGKGTVASACCCIYGKQLFNL